MSRILIGAGIIAILVGTALSPGTGNELDRTARRLSVAAQTIGAMMLAGGLVLLVV